MTGLSYFNGRVKCVTSVCGDDKYTDGRRVRVLWQQGDVALVALGADIKRLSVLVNQQHLVGFERRGERFPNEPRWGFFVELVPDNWRGGLMRRRWLAAGDWLIGTNDAVEPYLGQIAAILGDLARALGERGMSIDPHEDDWANSPHAAQWQAARKAEEARKAAYAREWHARENARLQSIIAQW